jgi:hypothetical protein
VGEHVLPGQSDQGLDPGGIEALGLPQQAEVPGDDPRRRLAEGLHARAHRLHHPQALARPDPVAGPAGLPDQRGGGRDRHQPGEEAPAPHAVSSRARREIQANTRR